MQQSGISEASLLPRAAPIAVVLLVVDLSIAGAHDVFVKPASFFIAEDCESWCAS
jgi:hypothetical protein